MGASKGLLGGLVGAAIGIGLWAAVVYFSGYEVGLIASFVGIFVGVGVAAAMGPNRGKGAALFAAVLAFLAVMGGKVTCAWIYSQKYMEEFAGPAEITEEYLVSCIADGIVAEYEWEGYEVDYPAGADLEFPDSREDYPADVWDEAESQWYAMSAEEQETYRAGVEFGTEAAPAAAFILTLIFSFGLFDLLWIGLAVSSAYKIVRDVPEKARKTEVVIEPEQPGAFAYFPGMPPPPGASPAGAQQGALHPAPGNAEPERRAG